MTLFIDISEKSLGKKDVTYRIGDSRHFGSGKVNSHREGQFTEEDKMQIVSEYVLGHIPASRIIEKYHIGSRQVLFN